MTAMPAGGQPLDQRRLQAGGAQPAVAADRRAPPPAPRQHGAEGAAERAGIRLPQRFADDAPGIVFAQETRVEDMPGHAGLPLPMPR